VLGLRPEHLAPTDETEGTIPAEVVLAEQMGAQTLLVCRSGDASLNSLISRNDRLHAGDRIMLGTTPEHVHLFDPEGGRSLSSSPAHPG